MVKFVAGRQFNYNNAESNEFESVLNPNYKIEYRNYFQNQFYSKYDLRNLIIPEEVNGHIPWFLDTPKDIRAEGVFESVKNLKAAITNKQRGNINHFEMKYLTKKSKKHRFCFGLPGSSFKIMDKGRKRLKIFCISTYTNDFIFKFSKPLPRQVINTVFLMN